MAKFDVSETEVEAALQELLHERNALGDGCFGCGYGGWWTPAHITNRIPFYRDMLKRILEVAKKANGPVSVSRPRLRLQPIENDDEGSE